MKIKKLKMAVVGLILSLCGIASSNASLVYRDEYVSQGYGLVYDSAQNITWTQFAVAGYNKSLSQAFGIVNTANSGGYYSLTGWRLPSETELLTLYGELPGTYGSNKVGTVQFGSGPNDHFSNIQPIYWSNHPPFLDTGIEVAFKTQPAIFEPPAGTSRYVDTYYQNSVWLVRNGDVTTVVPIPAASWMFGSALVGFIGFFRRKQ